MSAVPFQPSGYHGVTPSLALRDAAGALDFYRRAFGAEVLMKLDMPDGKIGHAEFKIGDAIVMCAEENAEWGTFAPPSIGGSPVKLMIYVPDVDAAFARAREAGATEVRPVADQFYGDRVGTVRDPYGYEWMLATHVEEVSLDEVRRRMDAMFAEAPSG